MDLESSIKFFFSNDFSLFAQVEGGKHIRVFDINTQKEHNYIIDTESGSTNTSEIAKIPDSGKNVIAIADTQGAIRIYDFKSKVQTAELIEHVSRILYIKHQEETGSLLSISADKKIIRWNLSSFQAVEAFDIDRKGTATEAKCDFIKDDITLLVSLDNKIMLYNTQLRKPERKFKGHPTHVHFLKAATGSKYFASCSNEDAIYIWNIEKEAPVLSLPILAQIFTNLDFVKIEKGFFLVLASSATNLRLWVLRATKTEIQVKSTVNIPFGSKDLLQARIFDNKSLMLAIFEETKPKFYIIPIFTDAQSNELRDEKTIVQDINSSLNQSTGMDTENVKKTKKLKEKENFHVLGENDENVLNQYKSVLGNESARKSASPEKNGNNFFLLDSIKPKDTNEAETMDSLAVVLGQALQNNDTQLLDYCFDNEDEDLIENTVKKLGHSKVMGLLDKITERIDSGKKGNYNLFAWLNFVVKYHSTFLIKSPETAAKIGPIISLLQKRVLSVDQIHRLKGKIDMVLDTGYEVQRQKKSQKKLNVEARPLVVYEEDEVQKAPKERPTKEAAPKSLRYTQAMGELEDLDEGNNNEKEFSDSISDSEGGFDDAYDAYLEGDAEGLDEGEDDDKESDESYIDLE